MLTVSIQYIILIYGGNIMGNIVPRVAAIHDMSGFGRCSLTVVMPTLSSMGIQVCPLPTALLSTHSGGFGRFTFHDFTDGLGEYVDHWKSLNISFDCIYSGFLGSLRQIALVEDFINDFKREGQLIVVDPVMADSGKLYSTYSEEMKNKMSLLVKKADIVTPNPTEACFLLEESYGNGIFSIKEMKSILSRISDMGPEKVVITGFQDDYGHYANMAYSRIENIFWRVEYENIPVQYPGTGDIFTSVLAGGIIKGDSLPIALDRATQFLSLAVKTTYECGTPAREGVLLEKVLCWLGSDLTQCTYEEV